MIELVLNSKSVIVLDLDDTLYKEIDFLKSAYKEISEHLSNEIKLNIYQEMLDLYFEEKDVFEIIVNKYKFESIYKVDLIRSYRNHYPSIVLLEGVKEFIQKIEELNIPLGLITDGRSITQRNKIAALGLSDCFDEIIISEEFGSKKPSIQNFQIFMDKYRDHCFYYIGDNLKKDFVTPNKLGWNSICLLDDGRNIHKQNFDIQDKYKAKNYIKTFNDIIIKYEK
ncbi:MAG: HAD family hydrolase [Melioribacteraceae bacterium]|nr:HAD family hydrolase [Melioribacteraceae bacterium]